MDVSLEKLSCGILFFLPVKNHIFYDPKVKVLGFNCLWWYLIYRWELGLFDFLKFINKLLSHILPNDFTILKKDKDYVRLLRCYKRDDLKVKTKNFYHLTVLVKRQGILQTQDYLAGLIKIAPVLIFYAISKLLQGFVPYRFAGQYVGSLRIEDAEVKIVLLDEGKLAITGFNVARVFSGL